MKETDLTMTNIDIIQGYKDKHEYISDKGVKSVVYLMDCMEGLKQIPDKYFELAIVDPPYFDGPQKTGYYKGTKQVCEVGKYKDLSGSWQLPTGEYFN